MQSPSALIACILHVVVFLWLFQLGHTVEESESIGDNLESISVDSYLKTYDFIVEEYGPIGLIELFFNHYHEARLYYRYAKLLLRGDATHWVWNEGMQFDTERPQPYRDVPIEYQPGAFLILIPPALIAQDFHAYRFWLAVWLGLIYALNLYLALQLLIDGRPTPAVIKRTLWGSLLFILCFGSIVVTRFDHAVVTGILLSLLVLRAALQSRGRKALLLFAAFGLVISLGVMTKIVPGLVMPAALLALLLLKAPGPDWRAAAASLAGLFAGLFILNFGFWMLWGAGVLGVLHLPYGTRHSGRVPVRRLDPSGSLVDGLRSDLDTELRLHQHCIHIVGAIQKTSTHSLFGGVLVDRAAGLQKPGNLVEG